jgi:RNA polymerase-binding transcription factor DksA
MNDDLSNAAAPIDERETRQRLDSEREKLQGMVAELRTETRQEANGQTGELSSYDQHPADLGSETFEREKDLSILESLEDELAEVEAALRRLDEGTYGIDEVTGERIDPERLDARPEARTNVDTPRP